MAKSGPRIGVEGAALHAFPLRTMDDAVPLRYHVLDCFERAAQTEDPLARRSLLRFVIVGGGATGVEYAGALAELIYGPLLKDFAAIARRKTARTAVSLRRARSRCPAIRRFLSWVT